MNKEIILAGSILGQGGVGKILSFVADNLLKNGFIVTVLSLRNEERPSFLPDKAHFISLQKEKSNNRLLRRAEELCNLRKCLRKYKPFVICTFGSEPSVMVRLATVGFKNTTVISAERSDPYTLPKFWKIMSSWAYKHSDYCVFQLEKQRDFYGEKVRKKSFVIPNAFIPKESDGGTVVERKVVVSAGRFVYQKGYDTLIRAFAKVSKTHPDYTLELYGGGEEKELYEGIIKEEGLEGKVKLFDYVKNVTAVIAGCSVFVLSSRFEGIPNVMIEAMSVGVPTVSTDCSPGGPAFLTDNGKRGLLVPVDDIDAMAMAICRIIEHSVLSNKLSASGSEICEILTESKIAAKWEEMFTNIINHN